MILYYHWSKVPADAWHWPNFSPEEIACRGTGRVGIDAEAMGKLQALRDALGAPLMINSAYRSPEHNKAVGGAKASQHLRARAFDISMTNHDPEHFERAARAVGFTGFGFYKRNNFIHVDTGPDREWGARWRDATASAPRFSPPPTLQPETVAEDQGAKGALVGAGGGVAALASLSGAIGNLSPTAQVIALVGVVALIAGLGLIFREKLRAWR